MPVNVFVDEEQSDVLWVRFRQPWNWVQFRDARQQVTALVTENPAMNTLIADVRDGNLVPPPGFMSEAMEALRVFPPLRLIFLMESDILRVLIQPVIKILHRNHQFFFTTSPEKAREIARFNPASE